MENNAKPFRFFYISGGTRLSGTANGCFAVITAENKCTLYNAKGEKVINEVEAFDGKLLNDGAYFLQHLPRRDSLRGKSFLLNIAVWSLFDKNGDLLLEDIDKCKIYANGWYQISKDEHHQLYRADHTLAAEGFTQCAVYETGYALRNNQKYYRYADWGMYTPEGEYLELVHDAISILGNGLVLQHIPGSQELYDLYDVEKNEKIAKEVTNYYYFPNGRFVLTFEDQSSGKFYNLYEPDGRRLGVSTQNARYLPDGRFIQYHNGRISALYRQNGLLQTDDIWTVEVAGNYYLIGFENEETLYNDKGKDLGNGYCLVYWLKNFALFENEQEYHLFNQYGDVLTFPIP